MEATGFFPAGQQGVDALPMSVRPTRDIEEDVFRNMMEPFDPTQTEVEQWVAGRERERERKP